MTTTTADRARKRASADRIRAMRRIDGRWYHVYNLTKKTSYDVWFHAVTQRWECTCPTNNLTQVCKHVQRVKDREEKRVRAEERRNSTEQPFTGYEH